MVGSSDFSPCDGAKASSFAEARLRRWLPTKPCAPPIARNLAVYGVNGLMVAMGVPAALTASGL